APIAVLRVRPEPGHWSTSGIVWSLAAGAVGALGALGIILALSSGGSPVYVMPLVFGCAPVVNTFLTMYCARSYKQAGPMLIAGMIRVVGGAVPVLVSRPHGPAAEGASLTAQQLTQIMLFTAMTALSWGVYGPTLHRGQMGMAGSRLRPLICVGLSY